MSFAGFSFETATRRGGGWEGGVAEVMRVRMEVRFEERSFARAGSIFISEVSLALWVGSVMVGLSGMAKSLCVFWRG